MSEVIRTEEEVKALLAAIQAELDNPMIVFGREEAQEMADDLKEFLKTGRILDKWSEVGYWLLNRKSFLGTDYGLE